MEQNDVVNLYDDSYAAAYDGRFLEMGWARTGAEFEEDVLRSLLEHEDPRWLDIGCGTGWFLSRFPGVARAGLDISPSMLAEAQAANPDALFLRNGDFRDDDETWHAAWSVVSCMWTAYNYVQSMPELDRLVENMVRWTRPGGAVFIPVMDLEDLRYVQIPYAISPEVWGGDIALTGVTWTWDEPSTGKRHLHLIAPHIDHFVALLAPHFEQIRVARYPLTEPGGVARKAVIATGRRSGATPGTATVAYDPLPEGAHDAAALLEGWGSASADGQNQLTDLAAAVARLTEEVASVRGAVAEVSGNLLRDQPATDDRYDIVGAIHEQVAGIRRELAELSQRMPKQSLVRRLANRTRRSAK